MKKILVGLFLLTVVVAVALGATGAYYYDEEVVPANQFNAGTLDLETCGNNMIFDDVKPGFTGRGGQSFHGGILGIQTYENVGNNPGLLSWAIRNVLNTEGLNPEPETNTVEPGDLGNVLYIDKVVIGTAIGAGNQVVNNVMTLTIGKTVNDLADDPAIDTGVTLPVGTTYYSEVYWSVPGSVGNEIMGDVCTFDIILDMKQLPVL